MKTKRRQHKRTKRTKRRRGGGPHTKQTTLSMGQSPLKSVDGRRKSMKKTKFKSPKLTKADVYHLQKQHEYEKKEARQHLHYLDQAINILNSTGFLKDAEIPSHIYKVDAYSLEFIKDPSTNEKIEYTLAQIKKLAEQQKHKPDLHVPRKSYYSKDFNEPKFKSPNFLASFPPLH